MGANYFYQFYNGKSNRQKADAVSTLETSPSDVNFVLEKMPTEGITGRVHDGKGNGIASTEVNVFSESITFGLNVVTDAEGYYTIKGLRSASDYVVSVWSDELETEFYYAVPEDQTPGEKSPTYSVFATKNATFVKPTEPPLPNIDIIVSADSGGSIKGSVYLADGETPVKNISVNAWSEEMQSGNSVKTDENGDYTIWGIEEVSPADVAAKGYIVEILSQNYPYQAYNRVSKKTDATRVGTGASGIDFYLKAGYAISGTVTDEDGNPVSGAEVVAWSAVDPQKQGTVKTAESGAYTIPDLPIADDYLVEVFTSDYPPQYYNLKADEDLADPVDITQGDAEHIRHCRK